MLRPVKRSIRGDTDLLGFVHFPTDAESLLGANVKEYDVTLPYTAPTIDQAWDAAETISNYWTEWIKQRAGGDPKAPTPRIEPKGDSWTLTQSFFLLSRDIPVGRSITEAIDDPVAFHPRTRRKKLFYQGKTPVYKLKETFPKSFARKSTVERKFSRLIASTAGAVIALDDGRYTLELIYWKLDPVQLPRDIKHEVNEHENFDLWGNWKVQETQRRVGSTYVSDIDEGSGRRMS